MFSMLGCDCPTGKSETSNQSTLSQTGVVLFFQPEPQGQDIILCRKKWQKKISGGATCYVCHPPTTRASNIPCFVGASQVLVIPEHWNWKPLHGPPIWKCRGPTLLELVPGTGASHGAIGGLTDSPPDRPGSILGGVQAGSQPDQVPYQLRGSSPPVLLVILGGVLCKQQLCHYLCEHQTTNLHVHVVLTMVSMRGCASRQPSTYVLGGGQAINPPNLCRNRTCFVIVWLVRPSPPSFAAPRIVSD